MAKRESAYECHEAANIFPLDDENLDALAEDIKEHGQLCPIELMDGKILDGRRRYMACRMAGVEAESVEVSPDDPVAYVISLNLHRRHLTPSQKSMVVARARGIYDKAAAERMKAGKKADPMENLPQGKGAARDAAGEAVGVSGKTVDFATKVLKHGTPELIKAVDEGRMAVSTAAVYASDPPEVQAEVLANQKNRKYESIAKPKSNGNGNAPDEDQPEGKSRGVGVQRAHEAIACLKRIPQNDALRKRGFQIVADWIKHNK